MTDKIIWKIDDPKELSSESQKVSLALARRMRLQKNPGLAFSLSLLVWGGGQIYNRQRALGFLFILLMANYYIALGSVAVYWSTIISALKADLNNPVILLGGVAVYLFGLIFWAFNAVQAYSYASSTRPAIYQGVRNPFMPVICSLLVPGWGQALNGQPKKAACFLLFSVAGLAVLPALMLIPWLWSTLEMVVDRFLLEKVLVISLALLPLLFFAWLLSAYDSLKVCLEPLKKEPISNRIEYAINRRRMNGWVRGLFPASKRTFLLGLFLVLSLGLGYVYLPGKDYKSLLQSLRSRSSDQGMVYIPRLINQFLLLTFPEEPTR